MASSVDIPASYLLLGDDEERGIFEFPIVGIPAGAIINGVEFKSRSNGNASTVEFFLYSGDGSVTVADATGGSSLGTFAVPVAPNIFVQNFNIAVFQTLLDAPATHFGLRFQSVNAGFDAVSLFGAESAAFGVGPMITVTFTPIPEPSTFALAALGLFSMGLVCRRRRPARPLVVVTVFALSLAMLPTVRAANFTIDPSLSVLDFSGMDINGAPIVPQTIPLKLSFAASGDESCGGDVRRGTATFG